MNFQTLFSVENAVSNEDVVIISDDDSVVLVETTIDKKEESGYLAETESSVSEPETSISFGSPPDHTEYLKLLYSGQADLIPEHMRPPPRDKQFNSSTPKKEDAI